MHRDIVHVPGPNQQRIGRIGGALIAVAAALDHQAQVIFAGKIHRLGDVVGISCRDRINARLGRPCVDPSQGLSKSGLIADVIWISQVFEEQLGGGAGRIVLSTERGKSTGSKFPPTASLSCFHADGDGHAASEGRRRRKFVAAERAPGKIGRSAADPIAFKNALRSITENHQNIQNPFD